MKNGSWGLKGDVCFDWTLDAPWQFIAIKFKRFKRDVCLFTLLLWYKFGVKPWISRKAERDDGDKTKPQRGKKWVSICYPTFVAGGWVWLRSIFLACMFEISGLSLGNPSHLSYTHRQTHTTRPSILPLRSTWALGPPLPGVKSLCGRHPSCLSERH